MGMYAQINASSCKVLGGGSAIVALLLVGEMGLIPAAIMAGGGVALYLGAGDELSPRSGAGFGLTMLWLITAVIGLVAMAS